MLALVAMSEDLLGLGGPAALLLLLRSRGTARRARAAARRVDCGVSSSWQTASAKPRASSATAVPQLGSTISGSAEERDTTTGVPDASASNAAKPKVSCGPGE